MYTDNVLLVSLDVGTYKTAVIVANAGPDGVDILGVGTALSSGVCKGLITNFDLTSRAIRQAVDEAEVAASCNIHMVGASIAGGYVDGLTSQGIALVQDGEVSNQDMASAIEIARTIALPADHRILHVLPREFLVDGADRGVHPVGAGGVRLEASVHVVTVLSSALDALGSCCKRSGLELGAVHFSALAAAEAVLAPEEKELGVVLLDIGAGVTSLAVFSGGVVRHTAVLRIGGQNITNDLAIGLDMPVAAAEKLKQRHGCALVDLLPQGEQIELPRIADREVVQVPRRRLGEIIEPRAEEILSLIHTQLETADVLVELRCGVVLTGGSAMMDGIPELAERVFRLPVRRGVPRHITGMVDTINSPMYATSVGLVLCGLGQQQNNGLALRAQETGRRGARERVVEWIREFF